MACQKQDANQDSAKLYPLKIGNEWTYKVTVSDSTHWSGHLYTVDTVVIKCSSTNLIDDKIYYHLSTYHPTISLLLTEDYLRWSNGNYYYHIGNHPDKEAVILNNNAQLGDNWGWSTHSYYTSYQVEAIDTTVNVLGQSFNQVTLMNKSIMTLGGGTLYSNYYQQGIGLVLQVRKDYNRPSRCTIELINYAIQ
ncbi:MAG: hypothetical protein AB8E82_04960 [Aureispira sp.]